jgi:hypothetical protein
LAIYLLFAKDWKSLSHMFLINRVYYNDKNTHMMLMSYVRAFFISLNEFVIFKIAISTNIGEDRGIGLIVNFGAALIICELDDIVMETGRMQKFRDQLDSLPDESEDPDEEP